MTLTTHAATGILVTQWTNNLWLGFFVAVASHFATDAIPHGDEWLYWRHVHNKKDITPMMVGATDVLIMCIILLLLLQFREDVNSAMVAVVTVGAILPDLLITLHTGNRDRFQESYSSRDFYRRWYHSMLQRHYRFHMFWHNLMHTPIRYRSAVAYQSVFLFGFVYFYILG